MSWSFTIPGQPLSGNHAYRIGKGYRRGGISYPRIIKTAEAEAYQQGIALLARTARPSGWYWGPGQMVICEYRFYVWDDIDCTNAIKVIEDGIFPALDINDTWALPRAISKEIVPKSQARVEVTIR